MLNIVNFGIFYTQVQHKDMQPVDDGNFYCVLCEYRTNKRQNLLVHMRKHNAWPYTDISDNNTEQPTQVHILTILIWKELCVVFNDLRYKSKKKEEYINIINENAWTLMDIYL